MVSAGASARDGLRTEPLQDFSTPHTPLESRVEMFTKGRPQSIVPITLGDRRMLRNSALHNEAVRNSHLSRSSRVPDQQRPVSEVTEILSSDDSGSEFEEDSDERVGRAALADLSLTF
jgi:hypothetical protein